MIFDLPLPIAAFLAAVVFVAAYVRGYSGFGYPVLVVAAGALVMNPLLLVPMAVLGDLVLCAQHARAARPHVQWPVMGRLTLGAAVGLLPGIWVLSVIDETTARIVIGVLVLLASAVMASGWILPKGAGSAATLGMGAVSGLAAPAGVAGPPAVMLVAALGLPPLSFRATLLAYFVVLNVMTFVQFWLAGRIDATVIGMTLASVPLVMIGSAWGARHVMRADPRRFRQITIAALAVMAAISLLRVWL